jgi:hypothetical protein
LRFFGREAAQQQLKAPCLKEKEQTQARADKTELTFFAGISAPVNNGPPVLDWKSKQAALGASSLSMRTTNPLNSIPI